MERLRKVKSLQYTEIETQFNGIYKIPHTPEYSDILGYERTSVARTSESSGHIEREYLIDHRVVASLLIDTVLNTWTLIEDS